MPKRRAHAIKANKNTELPHHVIFFDTETREAPKKNGEVRLTLRLGAAVYYRRREVGRNDSFDWLDFVAPRTFWDWVESHVYERSRTYLVAHNVVFDFKVLAGFSTLEGNGWSLKKLIVNGTSNIWEFTKGHKTITVLDDMNFFKSSLTNLGEAIGIPKLDLKAAEHDDEALRIYCRRDVEVMLKAWQIWLGFIKDNDLGCFGKTLASQSMNAYRHRFMKTPIYIHDVDRAVKVERDSYHGGRTECFWIGKPPGKNFHVLDVNSMYPSVMQKNDYPHKLIKVHDNLKPAALVRLVKRYCVTAEVEIEVTRPVFGVVHQGRLIFPVGRFKTTLTTRELKLAADNKWIRKISRTVIYEKANLFKEYVEFFYHRRMEYQDAGNKPFAYLCKIMLNSLYGKFGQRNEVFEKVGEDHKHPDGIERFFDLDLEKWITRRSVAGVIEESAGVQEGWNTFVAIAAHITADARLKLWDLIELAGRKNVFYCDTDSVFTNDAGLRRAKGEIKDGVLGNLSLKGSDPRLIIRAPKDYKFGDEEVIKGIRSDAEHLPDGRFKQTRFEGFAGALRQNRLDEMILSTVHKSLHREYKKGIVQSDGSVKPLELRLGVHGDLDPDGDRDWSRADVSPATQHVALTKALDVVVRQVRRHRPGEKGRSRKIK